MALKHAIMEAGRRRLKAIVMTSLTTILAVAPFLSHGDMGSDLQLPMSLTIISGMIVGTLVQRILHPAGLLRDLQTPPMNVPRPISPSRRGIPAFSVLLIMAALAVIGAAMLPMLNIQYTPSAAERRIDLYFSWPDASARLIEQSATSRIEGAMSTVAGCENVSSRSAKGYGNISVAFRKGTDMEAARFEVASAIRNLYAKLPQEISYPYISLAASGSRESETLVYTIKADLPSERIEEYVTAHVSTPLSQVEGVGRVVLSGVTPFEWVVTFDPKAMEAAGITATDLALAFRNYFRSDVVGMTTLPQADGSERSVVLKLRNRAGLDFGDIPVAHRNGRIYYLRDFATARWREALPASYFRINGLNTINLSVVGEPHTNILQVASSVKAEMQRLQASFPAELSATLTYDASQYVSGELHKIYLRTLLCVAILLLFVYLVSRDFRYLLIITVTLVVNILIAVVFYNLLRLDIHIYTLAGITVSLGIIIDTSIIMVDHYSYYRDRRVFVSILGALLTTIGALGIVWLLPEEQQANLTDFSLVIVVNLAVSLLIALLFVPSLLDKFPLRRSMTVSSVRRRRLIVRFSHGYRAVHRLGAQAPLDFHRGTGLGVRHPDIPAAGQDRRRQGREALGMGQRLQQRHGKPGCLRAPAPDRQSLRVVAAPVPHRDQPVQ